ncbi:uncharacterized protein BDR25DRAFT_351168 [Lindgomyces ingoldianus]|uniref:Uncharacterized protein n=1 Tax=Lindgomyces ingoldianus TaxID=673940 RepID=A0ACB6R6C6_9PLEO|nr:uncharacterized protein BDR25DRAFT_351168 [Lindgomyces ingoldianus]KAF2474632.1 hypothetical protein BDR25DRAFT_351168 [Lindgomyces ingoldianus]
MYNTSGEFVEQTSRICTLFVKGIPQILHNDSIVNRHGKRGRENNGYSIMKDILRLCTLLFDNVLYSFKGPLKLEQVQVRLYLGLGGDLGVGKSRLINSLLDKKGLTRDVRANPLSTQRPLLRFFTWVTSWGYNECVNRNKPPLASSVIYRLFLREYGHHYIPIAGSHYWNEEAIDSMKSDMPGLWDTFNGGVEAYLNCVPNDITSNQHSWLSLGRGRNRQVRHGDITQDYQDRMLALQTIGQPMEPCYSAANMKYETNSSLGSGSDRRRKSHITNSFRPQILFFDNHRRQFRDKFSIILDDLHTKAKGLMAKQVSFFRSFSLHFQRFYAKHIHTYGGM